MATGDLSKEAARRFPAVEDAEAPKTQEQTAGLKRQHIFQLLSGTTEVVPFQNKTA